MPTDPLGNQSGISSVSQGFAPIYSMIGSNQPSGGGSGAFGLQPQAMSGNSLTQGERAVNNLLGGTGAQLGQLGQNVLGAGLGISQGGLNLLQTPAAFWGALASGDPTAMTQVVSPQASALSGITAGALQNAGANLPGGGFRSQVMANLPAQQASQVGNFVLGLGPTAAQQLTSLGGLEGQLGLGIGGLGANLTSQGLQGLSAAQSGDLQKMQLNLQEGSPFQDILKAVGVAAPIAGGIAGLLGGGSFGGGASTTTLGSGYGTGMGNIDTGGSGVTTLGNYGNFFRSA